MWPVLLYILLIAVAVGALYGAYRLNEKIQRRRRKMKRAIRKKDDEWLKKQQAHLDAQRRQSH